MVKLTDPREVLRVTPDESAPNAPPRFIFRIFEIDAAIIAYLLLPIYLPYLAILYFFFQKPAHYPEYSFSRLWGTRFGKLQRQIIWKIVPAPLPEEDEWKIPKDVSAYWSAMKSGDARIGVSSVPPLDAKYQRGIGECPFVTSEKRPAFMITPKGAVGGGVERAKDGERVIYYIHGGGYVRQHPLWTPFPLRMAQATKQRVFAINYRKTVNAANAFPSPLHDALAGYLYLQQVLGFSPADITVMGDSAGAHLSLGLTRYLSELNLPIPPRIALSSPWVDFTFSFPSIATHDVYDTPHLGRLRTAVISATRNYVSKAVPGPYFSPALAGADEWKYLKKAGTRVYMMYGTKEIFTDEILALGKAMKEAGVEVTLRADEGGLHTGAVGWPEAQEVFKKDLVQLMDD